GGRARLRLRPGRGDPSRDARARDRRVEPGEQHGALVRARPRLLQLQLVRLAGAVRAASDASPRPETRPTDRARRVPARWQRLPPALGRARPDELERLRRRVRLELLERRRLRAVARGRAGLRPVGARRRAARPAGGAAGRADLPLRLPGPEPAARPGWG